MQRLLKFIKKVGYFVPFTIYLMVFAALIIPGYMWLRSLTKLPDSAYKDIFSLLLSVALLFSLAILCFGLITVLVSFVYFKVKQNKNGIAFELKTSNNNTHQHKQIISIKINPILLPIIGFLRVRILYDKDHYSHKFSPILKESKSSYFSISGEFNWDLPEIREYQIEQAIIYFEDFFQFFSMAATIHTSNRFHVNPALQDLRAIRASPRKTEETTTRIEELRRVEGELINYKHFENNDDVRRIVWKIYAKNKELVVRIPEIMDPYASHIYLYTSFHSQFNVSGNAVVENVFLNYYKTVCWSVYHQLMKKGFEVKYIPDKPIPAANVSTPEDHIKYAITLSSWQTDVNLKDFVKPGYASVLIVSSLNDLDQIKEFTERFGSEISIVFVPLTESLGQNNMKDWIKWLFVENENNTIVSDKTKWNVSPLRLKINEHERAINEVLKQNNKSTVI